MMKSVLDAPATKAEALASAARRAVRHLRLRFGASARVSSRDDTEHLLASPANAERLRAALRSSRAGEGTPTGADDLRAQVGLGES
jgi:hypothetical protein